MRSVLSRRAFVRAFSAAPVAAVSSASALSWAVVEHQPDAELLSLGVRFNAAEGAYRAACRRAEKIEIAIALPEKPAAAYDAWVAECDRINAESELVAASEAADTLGEALSIIEGEIEDAVARTLGGLRVKARMARRDLDIGLQINKALHESLIRDILAIGGAA